MLAEPRRQQKFILNPRSSAWAHDDSKFGQKMLEKMGWSKGKGLGKAEDGSTNPLSVNVKNDKTGVGFDKNQEGWIEHFDDFNKLLQALNESNQDNRSNTDSVSSLSEKSKSSKKRVHYKKFAEQKDLSLKDDKDLNCIFGTRVTCNGKSVTNRDTPANDNLIIQKMNSHDYFLEKKKINRRDSEEDKECTRQKKKKKKDRNQDMIEVSEDSVEKKFSITDTLVENNEINKCAYEAGTQDTSTGHKKKKRKNREPEQMEISVESAGKKCDAESFCFEDSKDGMNRAQKKRRKDNRLDKTVMLEELTEENFESSCLDDTENNKCISKAVIPDDMCTSQKKKKRKDKKLENIVMSGELADEVCTIQKKKKSKDRKPGKMKMLDESVDKNFCANSEDNKNKSCISKAETQDEAHAEPKKKKRKTENLDKMHTSKKSVIRHPNAGSSVSLHDQ